MIEIKRIKTHTVRHLKYLNAATSMNSNKREEKNYNLPQIYNYLLIDKLCTYTNRALNVQSLEFFYKMIKA